MASNSCFRSSCLELVWAFCRRWWYACYKHDGCAFCWEFAGHHGSQLLSKLLLDPSKTFFSVGSTSHGPARRRLRLNDDNEHKTHIGVSFKLVGTLNHFCQTVRAGVVSWLVSYFWLVRQSTSPSHQYTRCHVRKILPKQHSRNPECRRSLAN
jgi:hypothetical protein